MPDLHDSVGMAFSFMRAQMDRDATKYAERCAINAENGSKGGRPRKANKSENNREKPKETERFLDKPRKPDTDTDTGTDTGTDSTPLPPRARGTTERRSRPSRSDLTSSGTPTPRRSASSTLSRHGTRSSRRPSCTRQSCRPSTAKRGATSGAGRTADTSPTRPHGSTAGTGITVRR